MRAISSMRRRRRIAKTSSAALRWTGPEEQDILLWQRRKFPLAAGSCVSGQVPTGAQKAGDFSSDPARVLDPLSRSPFPGNIIPDSRISPVSKKFLPFWPAPNTSLSSPNFINSGSGSVNDDQYVFRADHTFSDRWKLFA